MSHLALGARYNLLSFRPITPSLSRKGPETLDPWVVAYDDATVEHAIVAEPCQARR
jgi:hypothetical protein